jgi:signal transduction histidine kinase
VLFAVMALCQAANLVLVALESGRGLGLPGLWLAAHMPLQLALDLCTAAAGVHVFSLYPAGLPRARVVSAVAWACVAAWLALALAGWVGPVWWTGQSLCIALGLAALWVAGRSHAVEPNPYTRVTRRLSAAALIAMVAVTLAVAFTAQMPARERAVAAAAPAVLYGLLALQLLFTPFLSHSRQLLREFVLLAAICAVASVLGLLFVAVFSIGKLASLACAALIGLGLYLGARQWLLNRLAGASLLATERAFEQIYRAARTVQAHPQRYGKQLTQLLRDLFEPLEVERTDRVPERSRLLGGGSTLVVPLRGAADQTGSAPRSTAAIALRFAHQGRRLFTLEDARLADRLIDQLRRAVAYDMAVEHGRSEERQRIAQDLHDDIGARLLTLMYRTQDPEMENYIRHTLQDLKTLTRGLAASEHRLSHAAAEWKADLMQRATVAQVELRWSFAFDRDLLLSMVQWSALTRVLRELVSNALFHGEATQIDVTFALQGPQMTLQVADDGNGRSPEQWAHGLGLGGVRKRVKALGGEVAWVENRDRGIVCKVRVARFGEPG